MLHYSAGLLLAAASSWQLGVALQGFIATAMVIAAGCVVNNILDRNLDRVMTRTKLRATATGNVSVPQAVIFAIILGGIGFGLLALTNTVTLALGMVGFVSYAFVYTYAKRYTVHHTLIGAVPGALPVVAGYTTLSGLIDTSALCLFFVVFVWQLPHFYAIGMYRRKEYARAAVPLLSNRLKLSTMRWLIIITTGMYVAATAGLAISSLTIPAGVLLVSAGVWWWHAMFVDEQPTDGWARTVFRHSLIVALALPLAMALNLFVVNILM